MTVTRNRRLEDAIRQRGWDTQRLAEEIEVDAKSVERWVRQGRVPHSSNRVRASRCLGIPAAVIWPEATNAPATGVGELVAAYPARAEIAPSTIRSLLSAATRQVDVLAYAATWLWDAVPCFVDTLIEKIDTGCQVRICLGDPDSAAVRLRGNEEGIGDALAARCRLAITYVGAVARRSPASVRLSDRTLYASVMRFDDEVLVNHHLWGNPASCSPVIHLRRSGAAGMASGALESFDRVWSAAQPVG